LFPDVIDRFYHEVRSLPTAGRILEADPERIPRLKQTLREWLDDFFSDPFDQRKVEKRYQVGRRHVELGLDFIEFSGGFARLRMDLMAAIGAAGLSAAEQWQLLLTVNRALDIDLSIMQAAYHAAAISDLTDARRAAESASRARSRFLASTSHELRTPLTAILGMTELLLDSKLSPAQRSYLSVVQHSAESLLMLIGDVLDFAKLEADKLVLHSREFPLHDTLSGVLKGLAFEADRKGLELVVEISPEVPERARGDPDRICQVLVNLVGNAVKFTNAGRVVVRVEAMPLAAGDRLRLRLSVEDTGIGIEPEDQRRLFQPFEQLEGPMPQRPAGTGLGLAISARLVAAMGGQIDCRSCPGQGSRFTVTCELGAASNFPTDVGGAEPRNRTASTVLVISAKPAVRQILREALRRRDCTVVLCKGPAEALQYVRRGGLDGQEGKAVLVDAQFELGELLPLVTELRSAVAPPARLALLMRPVPDDRVSDLALRLQAKHCFTLPLTLSEIDELLVAQSAPETGCLHRDESAATAVPLRILVADDQPYNRLLLEEWLKHDGHIVESVENGVQVFEALGRAPFDVLLLDMQMPELDGFATAQRIRQREAIAGGHLSIFIMSAGHTTAERASCEPLEIDGYIPKPMRRQELRGALSKLAADRTHVKTSDVAIPFTQAADDLHWNPRRALELLDGNHRLLRRVAQAFCSEAPQLLNQLRTAVDNNDLRTWKCLAHGLKGAMQTLGANHAARTAAQLEAFSENSSPGSRSVAVLLNDLILQVTDVVQRLEELTAAEAAPIGTSG
jgi:signal transduction histidine kinase/DNA-binding response OmpR family regulator